MTDSKTVSPTEHGVVRVFVLIRPADMKRGHTPDADQFAEWLGVTALNMSDVQHIWTDDLVEPVGLREMLVDGYGIDAAQVDAAMPHLNGAKDLHPTMFVFVRSGAFMGRAVTLHEDGPLYVLETFTEPGANVTFEPLPNPDPTPAIQDRAQKKKPSDAAMSGRVATVALLVMGLLVWLMIRIAG